MLAEEADIVLDTFPFNGHTTTWQALWMGAPVVTLAGRAAHRSRMGASILTNIGLPELIAHDEGEFLTVASGLAKDLPRLRELRIGLRERMRRSVIQDGAGFTRDLEAAYVEMIRSAAVAP
jgi:predicted O-linked N-acetylglucosamine transferase (SPINDLY family)